MKERPEVTALLQACLALIEQADRGLIVPPELVDQAADAVADYVEAHPS